jgi:hypothetical protein
VLVEARVFSGDHGVLEVGRDLAEGNEFVVLVVGRAVDEGLEAALDVDSGRRRVDPLGSDEGERGGEPGSDEGEGKAEKDGSDKMFAAGFRGVWAGGGGHLSE